MLRQYRIIIVVRPRRQIFRQIVQKFRRHTNVCQEISVQDGGKYARGRAAKAEALIVRCCLKYIQNQHYAQTQDTFRLFSIAETYL